MRTQRRAGTIAVCALAAGAAVTSAATTKIWVSDSASDFSSGEARGIAVGIDGSLVLSRSTRRVDGISEASLFAIAAGKDGTEYVATGDSGRILRISQGTLCVVLLDTGKEQSSIFWMLRDEGASAETNDKLVAGTYACYAGNPNQYTFMDLKILSANSYLWAGQRGQFHVEPSRKIVYETGPLATPPVDLTMSAPDRP